MSIIKDSFCQINIYDDMVSLVHIIVTNISDVGTKVLGISCE